MTGATTAAFTVRVNEALPVSHALAAEMVNVMLPVELGVPVIAPVRVLRLAQLGSPVAAYDVGLPEAEIW
jgi:hypothetical protein